MNIEHKYINPRGVHLNRSGTSVLSRNILNHVNKDEYSSNNAAIENSLPAENSNARHDFTNSTK